MSSIEICEEMKQHWEVFLENHERFNENKLRQLVYELEKQ